MWAGPAAGPPALLSKVGGRMRSNMRELRWTLRRRYSGVMWQNPALKVVLPAVDAADQRGGARRELGHLPRFSVRIHSTSVVDEFGGRRWISAGQMLKRAFVEDMGLKPTDRVLEVGCGGGRQ